MTGKPKAPKQTAPTWGGVREGAGAPLKGESAARVGIAFRLTEDEAARLSALARPGESIHQTARRIVLDALEVRG